MEIARLGHREDWRGDDDLVFASDTGDYLSDFALRVRYKSALTRAGLRNLRFHDLRHTFGTRMISKADVRRVQEWMGHADIQTTMKYLHYAPHAEDARLVAEAFAVSGAGTAGDASGRSPQGKRPIVPRLSEFYGIVIYMYRPDHPPAHFHARYGEHWAQVAW